MNKKDMAITVKNISFSYGSLSVLDDISLDFIKGKFAAIIGPNGCGKTTLFNIICRILPVQSGKILLHDKELSEYTRNQQARTISVLSQSDRIPDFMTVYDMIMQGRFCYQSFLSRHSDEDEQIVTEAMKIMEIGHLANKRVSHISGGQLQRCRMAMTLAQQTDIILMDEPTTHLDLKHQYILLDMGKELVQSGKTVVTILHDITQASIYADHVIILHNSNIYAEGNPHEVINNQMMEDVFDIKTKKIGNGKISIYVPSHLSD